MLEKTEKIVGLFEGTTLETLNEVGVVVNSRKAIEVLRLVDEGKTHRLRGHIQVVGLGSVPYKSDYIVFDYDRIYIEGNEIALNLAKEIKIFVSHAHWYDIHVKNEHGSFTMCYSPK